MPASTRHGRAACSLIPSMPKPSRLGPTRLSLPPVSEPTACGATPSPPPPLHSGLNLWVNPCCTLPTSRCKEPTFENSNPHRGVPNRITPPLEYICGGRRGRRGWARGGKANLGGMRERQRRGLRRAGCKYSSIQYPVSSIQVSRGRGYRHLCSRAQQDRPARPRTPLPAPTAILYLLQTNPVPSLSLGASVRGCTLEGWIVNEMYNWSCTVVGWGCPCPCPCASHAVKRAHRWPGRHTPL
jgi:hypothetical protein